MKMKGSDEESRSDNIEIESSQSQSNLSENTLEANDSRNIDQNETEKNTSQTQQISSTQEHLNDGQCVGDERNGNLKLNHGESIPQIPPFATRTLGLGSPQGPSNGISIGSGDGSAFTSTNRPGAFFVPAGAPQTSQETNNQVAANNEEVLSAALECSSIPVAPIGAQNPMPFNVGRQLIIDGEIVRRRDTTHFRINLILAFVTSVSVAVIIYFFLKTREANTLIESSFQPTLSPSTSISPTTWFNYDDYVKQILIPISGESVFNNSSSLEYVMWKLVAGSIPRLLDESILQLNDTHQIRQRYIMGIIRVKLSADPDYYLNLMGNQKYGKLCELFPCDVNGEITVFELKNQWSTGLGGGVIATEIGELRQLRHIILPRNGIRGTLPTEIGKLKSLNTLDLHQNSITGKIPTELGYLSMLDLMFLDSNFFQQSIPSQLGYLTNMKFMNMSMNLLTGSIPTEFDNMRSLEGMILNKNYLTGSAEFLCDNNFTTGSASYNLDYLSQPYAYTIRFGVVVDCIKNQSKLECSCCSC